MTYTIPRKLNEDTKGGISSRRGLSFDPNSSKIAEKINKSNKRSNKTRNSSNNSSNNSSEDQGYGLYFR
jgi:hypothetical protein